MNKTRYHIRKVIALLLTMAMILGSGVLVFGTAADPVAWDGTVASDFAGGSGTEGDPWIISTPAQWAYFAAQVTAGTTYSGKYIKLDADLVFNTGNAADWATTPPANEIPPVGYDGGSAGHFAGTFDGQGYTVSGVYTNQPANTYGYGLFGATNGATIKNLRMSNSAFKITTKGWSGALVGEVLDGHLTTIQNVYLDNTVYVTSTQNSVGGIVGGIDSSGSSLSISNSVFAGTVSASGKKQVGGFVGNGNAHTVTITNCLMIGSVIGGSDQVCGFIGVNGTANNTLTGCVYAGIECGKYPFFQSSVAGATVSNCYSIGTGSSGHMYRDSSNSSANVTSVTMKDLWRTDASVTISGWTKRANDIMIPTGVATFAPASGLEDPYAAPDWLANYESQTDFYISTTEQWVQLSKFIAGDYATSGDFAGKNVVLAANITFNTGNAANWGNSAPANKVPTIGSDGHPFKGTFDGQSDDGNTNYVISGVYIKSSADGTGLFGEIGKGATIRNVTLVNSYIECGQWSGALVGEVSGAATVKNCYLGKDVYVVSTFNGDGNANVGGLIGGCYGTWASADKLQINSCVFAGSVTARKSYVGGILGTPNSDENKAHTVLIEKCLNAGSIKGKNVVAGIATGAHKLTVDKCVNTGSVTATTVGTGSECADIWVGNCAENRELTVTNCIYTGTMGIYNTAGVVGSIGTLTASGNTHAALADLIGTSATAPSGWTKTAGELAYPSGVAKNKALVSERLFTFGLENGASVRLQNPTGLRFTAVVSKTWLASLDNVAGYGIVIAPTSYVKTAGAFTIAALDGIDVASGSKYLKIPAANLLEETADYAVFSGVIGNIREENYSVDFSAIAYVEFENGQILYSAYDSSVNSRSVAHVARLAHEDVIEASESGYTNAVAVPGATAKLYSLYSSAQRATLEGFYRDEKEIRVLQQNLLRDESTEEARSYAFLKEVAKYDPDIILLQEVDKEGNWYNYALKYLTDYTLVGVNESTFNYNGLFDTYPNAPATYIPAILYRTDRFTANGSGTFWLTNTPDTKGKGQFEITVETKTAVYEQNSNRPCAYVNLLDGNNGNAAFTCSSLHFSTNNVVYVSGDTGIEASEAGAAVREKEAEILLNYLGTKAGGNPILFGGDVNDGSSSRAVTYIIGEGYKNTYHNTPVNVECLKNTITAGSAHIDWCFYGENDFTTVSYHVLLEKFLNKAGSESVYVSDHCGIVSDVVMN